VDESVAEEVRRELQAQGACFLNAAEQEAVAKGLVTPQRLPNPALVGKSATYIASKVGITVPEATRVLIAPLAGVGRDYPLSIEKLCPVLSYYVVKDWREGCERCIQILRYGGMGHTMSIHSRNEEVILQFGLKKPAFRICVNTPTTHGSIGLTTGLDPAMTLGCGGWGGNITSDNISPRHLLNIKRLAYEIRPAFVTRDATAAKPGAAAPSVAERPLPKAPARPRPEGIPAQTLLARIDQFLQSRGYRPAEAERTGTSSVASVEGQDSGPLEFVCEEDVRSALRSGRKLIIGDKTIVTPAARELGEEKKVFIQGSWPG
jgi:acetaldehyde dehydrogenase (acetylating)